MADKSGNRADRPKHVPMPERPPEERRNDWDEVPRGYTPDQARQEASRCLLCKKSPCIEGCPVGIDIPGFVKLIADGKFEEAADRILLVNALAAVCGRVCPQETQCEILCVLGKKGEPLAIGNLERFAADWKREQGTCPLPTPPAPSGFKVAVVRSGGPAEQAGIKPEDVIFELAGRKMNDPVALQRFFMTARAGRIVKGKLRRTVTEGEGEAAKQVVKEIEFALKLGAVQEP